MKKLFFLTLIVMIILSACTPQDKFYVGKIYEGGVIFYYDTITQSGLIATNYDIGIAGDSEGTNYNWGLGDGLNSDGTLGYFWSSNNSFIQTSNTFGSGASNTQTIVDNQGIPTSTQRPYAAYVCSQHTHMTNAGEKIDDWYLPSIDELNLLYYFYKSKTPAAGGENRIGIYWSSSQGHMSVRDSIYRSAECLNFYDKTRGADLKTSRRLIRAVRSFKVES